MVLLVVAFLTFFFLVSFYFFLLLRLSMFSDLSILPYLITAALSFTPQIFKNLITYYYYQSRTFNNIHRITFILLVFDTLDFMICKCLIFLLAEMFHCSDLELYWTSFHLLTFKYRQPHVTWLCFSLSFVLPPTLMSSLEKSATFLNSCSLF